MKYYDVFYLISSVCSKNKVSYVLIGGFAVNYHKVARQTADVDFLITKEDFEKIAGLLQKDGFKQSYVQEVFARLTAQEPYFMDLDFMFVDKETLDKIIQESEVANIGNQQFRVPCLNHLIALKLHAIKYNPGAREYKDLADIIELIKVNNLAVKGKLFKDLCLKYGTEELYRKILEKV